MSIWSSAGPRDLSSTFLDMPYRFGKATAAFGWLLVVVGIAYVALGVRDSFGGVPGYQARHLRGSGQPLKPPELKESIVSDYIGSKTRVGDGYSPWGMTPTWPVLFDPQQ